MLIRLFIYSFLLISIISCNDDEFTTGSDFFGEESFQINGLDTLSLDFSTVSYDSITTNTPSQLLVGRVIDDIFGDITATFYSQLLPDTTSFYIDPDEFRYDSISVVLYYSNYYYGDTTNAVKIIAQEVSEDIEANSSTYELYNNNDFETRGQLGELTFMPRPFTGEYIEIPLSDNLGSRLYSEAQSSSNAFIDYSEFLDLFKGIKLSMEDTENLALGFGTNVEVRLYFSDLTTVPAESRYLRITNTGYIELNFNHIQADRSTSLLNALPESESSLSSTYTNNKAFIQSGTALGVRVEIPNLKKVREDNPELFIKEAILELIPVKNQYVNEKELVDNFSIYLVDHKNRILTTYSTQFSLVLDSEFDRNTSYSIDIASFLEYQLSLDENNNNALLILPTSDDVASTLHHVTIGDNDNSTYKSKLTLNLIELK